MKSKIDNLIARSELALKLSITTKTIYNWEKKGLPVYRLPEFESHPKYDYEEVLAWLQKSK